MAAAKGGTPLSSRPLFLFSFNFLSVAPAVHTASPFLGLCASWKLSPAAGAFDRSSVSKGLWGGHGSSQAIKQLHTLKVGPSTFPEQRDRETVCLFSQVRVCSSGWEVVGNCFSINGYISLWLRLLVLTLLRHHIVTRPPPHHTHTHRTTNHLNLLPLRYRQTQTHKPRCNHSGFLQPKPFLRSFLE